MPKEEEKIVEDVMNEEAGFSPGPLDASASAPHTLHRSEHSSEGPINIVSDANSVEALNKLHGIPDESIFKKHEVLPPHPLHEDGKHIFGDTSMLEAAVREHAQRFNDDKPQWSLVDFESFEDMVKVLEFGAKKYSANNWKKGLEINKLCESMLRHVFAFMNGETNDPESGLPHIGHIQCNTMFIAHMMKHKPHLDDRAKSIGQEL